MCNMCFSVIRYLMIHVSVLLYSLLAGFGPRDLCRGVGCVVQRSQVLDRPQLLGHLLGGEWVVPDCQGNR